MTHEQEQSPAEGDEDRQRALRIASEGRRFVNDRSHLGGQIYVNDLAWALGILADRAADSNAQPKGTALSGTPPRVDYVKAARVYALAYGLHDDAPSYLPRTQADADAFEPHAWVIGAMMQAFGDGWADGHAAGMAVMKEAAKRQMNLNDPSVQKRLAAQWGYVQAPAVVDGWQPIETAPKDGQFVLLFGAWAGEIHGKSVDPGIYVGSYAGGGDYAAEGYLWSVDGGDAYGTWCKPTHWMPLPSAPSAQAEPATCPHTGQCHPGFCPCSDAKRQAEQKGTA